MQKRELGNSGLAVAPLALGGNVFGWTVDEPASFRLLDRFVDEGFDLVDTADVYSRWVPGNRGGESETIIGNWFVASGKRDRVVLATKVGWDTEGEGRGLSRKHVLRSVEGSLRRLRTDRIDLYQAHVDDPETHPEETLEAFAQLVREGKVRAIGASNYTADRLSEALAIGRERGLPVYCSLQPHYNLYDRAGYERDLEPLCRKEGLGVIPYYGLASGFLSGKYRSEADLAKSPRGRIKVAGYLNERGLRILSALDEVGSRLGAAPATVALAWLIARPGITAPIASATGIGQLEEIMAAPRLSLDAESLAQLTRASD